MTLPPAEPYRIKVVEPIRRTTREERAHLLAAAGYNLFNLRAGDVSIDLLTDSGTGAMSDRQWSALMQGDEAYAGSRSFEHLREAAVAFFGFPHVLPTHQGRGAEHLLFTVLVRPGQHVIGNIHFDTTRAHIEHRGGIADDLAAEIIHDPSARAPFKGDLDLEQAAALIEDVGREAVALIHLTVTCNSGGGQPVSLANLRAVRELADRYHLPLFLDAARIAENAFFIKEREAGYGGRTVASIIREMCGLADGCTFSGKKDALVNIGGLVAFRDRGHYEQAASLGVLFEGFPTYGGLAGRDLEAMAQGLREVVDEDYLAWRIGQVRWLGERLIEQGVPIVEPVGGHAVFLDALRALPHLPRDQYPGQALACALYEEGGVRGVEIGAVMAGRDPRTGQERFPRLELVRLAVPRRVYTQSHMAVVAGTVAAVHRGAPSVRGLRIVSEPPLLRHFLARFAPV